MLLIIISRYITGYICYSPLNFVLYVHPGKELSVDVVRNSL